MAPTSTNDLTIERDSRGERVDFEGRSTWMHVTRDVEALRASAERLESEAADRLYRARRARALADRFEVEQTTEAERKATQRRERAAATRAHKADPFGFESMRARKGP